MYTTYTCQASKDIMDGVYIKPMPCRGIPPGIVSRNKLVREVGHSCCQMEINTLVDKMPEDQRGKRAHCRTPRFSVCPSTPQTPGSIRSKG
jgi:hypothetical protein